MRTLAIALLMAAAASNASEPAGFNLWKSTDLATVERKLTSEMGAQKIAMQVLASYGKHSCMMAHRNADGEAEWHETQNDVFFVHSGEGTLVVGGRVVNPHTSAPHEIRGPSIDGGERRTLTAGDVVHIPVKTPHQMLVAAGHQITYFVVKIDAQ